MLCTTTSEVRTMTMILRRMFSRRAAEPFVGIRKRMKFLEKNESIESFDAEDLDEFESDFTNVGESHKMYERYVCTYTKMYNAFYVIFIFYLRKTVKTEIYESIY